MYPEIYIPTPHDITQVLYDAMLHGSQERVAITTIQCLADGSKVTIPIRQASLSLLPSPQQRALEAQAAKDAQEIKALKGQLATAKFEENNWRLSSNQNAKEIKRLEALCGTHWEAKEKAERECKELVGELHDAKNQLQECRVANGKLMDKTKELEKHSKTMEHIANTLSEEKNSLRLQVQELQSKVRELEGQVTPFATRAAHLEQECSGLARTNTCQAFKIQVLESQLNLLKHQYEGRCQAVRDLRTAGMSKERDEYSKALAQKETQISQITKQAGEWKQTASDKAKAIGRLEELVFERTKERDALQAEKGLCPCKPSEKLDPWGKEFWADYPLPVYPSGFHCVGMASQPQAAKQTVAETLTLNGRVTALETKVAKLEEADGFPMESCQAQEGQDIMAYMGGQWVKARKSSKLYYSIRTPEFNKNREWDLANQPTRWKPMPK